MTFDNFKAVVVLNLILEPFFFKGTKNYLLASFSSLIIYYSESITTSASLKFKIWSRIDPSVISSTSMILFFRIDLKILRASNF